MDITENKQSCLQLIAVQAGGVICLPIFIIGKTLAINYGVPSAILAIIIGNLLLLVIGVISARASVKDRKSTAEYAVDLFGGIGRRFFATAMVLSLIGWFAIQLNIMTLGIQQIFPSVSGYFSNIALGLAVTLAGIKGMQALERIVNWSMPLLLLTIGYALFQADPVSIDTVSLDVFSFSGVSLVLATAIAAVVDLPTFFRLARSPMDGVVASCILFGLIIPLLEGAGVYLFANSAEDNFVHILATPNSPLLWKSWVFAFILFAGWTTNQANLYSASVSLSTIAPTLKENSKVLVLGSLASILSCFHMLENLIVILDLIGVILGSMGAVLVVHILANGGTNRKMNLFAWFVGMIAGVASQYGYTYTGIPVIDAFAVSLIVKAGTLVNQISKNRRITNENAVYE